jgi:hypothetical protein
MKREEALFRESSEQGFFFHLENFYRMWLKPPALFD